jgi:DNA polymerase III delta prime subunit
MTHHPEWTERYRPATISDCVLPKRLKDVFQGFVDTNTMPNLLLTGSAGVGKTSVAYALISELGFDSLMINASLRRDIGLIKNEVTQFASSVSFGGGRKCVVFDEADYLNAQSTQPALRHFMEEFSRNCGFILTCNYPKKIIEPIHSRCSVIEFSASIEETVEMGCQFIKRIKSILDENGIAYDHDSIADLVRKHLPDWRRVLNELQRYSVTGAIDAGILITIDSSVFDSLKSALKTSDDKSVRKWVRENREIEPFLIFDEIYDTAKSMTKTSKDVTQITKIIARYQFQATANVNQKINTEACLYDVMEHCS